MLPFAEETLPNAYTPFFWLSPKRSRDSKSSPMKTSDSPHTIYDFHTFIAFLSTFIFIVTAVIYIVCSHKIVINKGRLFSVLSSCLFTSFHLSCKCLLILAFLFDVFWVNFYVNFSAISFYRLQRLGLYLVIFFSVFHLPLDSFLGFGVLGFLFFL